MPILSKASPAARTALIYVTIGALVLVWTCVWFIYLVNHHPDSADYTGYYWCGGFLATGLILLLIGFGVGRLGRAARHAELPPPEVTSAVATAEQMAAARAPIVAPNPAASAAGQVMPVGSPSTAAAPSVPAAAPVAAVPGQLPAQR